MNLLKKINILQRLNDRKRVNSIVTAHKLHRSKFSNDYVLIDEVIKRFRVDGGLNNRFNHYKLWELQKFLNKYKPKSILELGSGSSTCIFAKYASANSAAVVSYDESKHWIENTKNLLGNDLADCVSLKHAERCFNFDDEITTVNYSSSIEGSFDFVMVDGPSLKINNIRRKDAVNADVLGLSTLPKIIIVDGRQSTFNYLAAKLANKYRVIHSDLHSQAKVKEGYQYFSYLELM